MNSSSSTNSGGGGGIIVTDPEGSSSLMRRRCELYLALSITSLISICCVAVSASRSEIKSVIISCASLSCIVTLIVGLRLLSRSLRYSLMSRWMIRSEITLEKKALLIVLVLECIVSGMVLYPRFDTNRLAVVGNEIWNPNLFYITWFSLYVSAYLVEIVVINAVQSSWFMCLFSSTCTATALLIIHSGPACRGKYLSDTAYCSSALAAGSVNVMCAVMLLVCGACGLFSVARKGRLLKYLMLIGATILLIVQCAVVAVVTAPSGPGHETGNAFIASWMSLITSLLLWKTSFESWLMPEPRENLSSFKGYLRKNSSNSTVDEGYSDDDHGNSCDPLSDEPSDIPDEVQAGDDNYWRNLRGPDPDDDTFNNSHRRAQESQVLKEADAILFTVAEIIRREDPRGITITNKANPDRSRVRAMEPPSSRESRRPYSNINKSVDVDRERRSCPLAPIPTKTGTATSSSRLRHQVRKSPVQSSHSSHNPNVSSSARYQVRTSTGRASRSSVPSRRQPSNSSLNPLSTITSQIQTVPSRGLPRRDALSSGETTLSSALPTESSPRSKYYRGIKPSISTRNRPPSPPMSTQHQLRGEAPNKTTEKKKAKKNNSPLTASTPVMDSPDSEMCTIPVDVLLKDDQSSITELTIHVPDSQHTTPTSAKPDRKALSVAVSAALHAASVAAVNEKMAHSSDGVKDGSYNLSTLPAMSGQSLLPTKQHQIDDQSESIQIRKMDNDNVTSPPIRAFSRRSTLEQAEMFKTYSDLEDSKLNIQGGNNNYRHTDPATGLVGILKHGHSSSHRKTPSQSSTSKWSEQPSTPSNKSPSHNESDMLLRIILSERLQGGPTAISTPMHELRSNHRPLPRRQSSTVEQLSQTFESCSNPTRSSMHSRYSEDEGDDDTQTVHVEFNC